jgi:alpha-glucosidase
MEIFAFHAPTPELFFVQDKTVYARLKLPATLQVTHAWLRSEPDNEEFLSEMKLVSIDESWQIWQGTLKLDPAHDLTLYAFKFILEGVQYWLSETGITPYFPERDVHFRYVPSYQSAQWVWSQVFYQIFPERFYDGDPSNNVKENEYLYNGKPVVSKAWNELPDRKQGVREFYGGDLEGIRQKLPYLQELGITALYLNPIFTSPSSHKYDTIDYETVDPHFGGNAAFVKLCADLKANNIRLMLDAVVNHTSERHPWFDLAGEYEVAGAFKSKDAKTRSFYTFLDDERYVSFYGVRTMPILNFASEDVQRYIYKDEDAMLRKWLRPPYSIDGWRFDVIHMLGEEGSAKGNSSHVRGFRAALRQENPEAYVLGEHFFEATKWLQGDQEDGAMNYYGFTLPLRQFLSGIEPRGYKVQLDAKDFDLLLQRARAKLPFPIQLSQFNFLGTHDSSRISTMLKNDAALIKLAVTMLFTYIGVPCVYYGDEVGLEGGDDPDCRRTFPWEETLWNHDLRQHYQNLIALRKDAKVLQEGAFVPLYAEGDVYAYARVLQNQSVITVLNRGEKSSVTLPVWKLGTAQTFTSFFNERDHSVIDGWLELPLAAKSSLVLMSK